MSEMLNADSGTYAFHLGAKAFILGSRPFGALVFSGDFDCIEVVAALDTQLLLEVKNKVNIFYIITLVEIAKNE